MENCSRAQREKGHFPRVHWSHSLVSVVVCSCHQCLFMVLHTTLSICPPTLQSQGGLDSDSEAESSGLFASETDCETKTLLSAGSDAGEGLNVDHV